MSRFQSLEFGGAEGQQKGTRQVLKDERFYLEEAALAFAQGDFEAALRFYGRVLEFNPRNPQAWTGQVRMFIELGRVEEANKWANKALDLFPEEAELLAAKAVALARLGETREAMTFSDASIEGRSGTPYVWLARGEVLLARKEARSDYCVQQALDLAPRDWKIPWMASRLYFYYQKLSLALKMAQQALVLDSAQGSVWFQVGSCQLALGLVGPAEHSLNQARQLHPANPRINEALLALAKSSSFLGRVAGRLRQLFMS